MSSGFFNKNFDNSLKVSVLSQLAIGRGSPADFAFNLLSSLNVLLLQLSDNSRVLTEKARNVCSFCHTRENEL